MKKWTLRLRSVELVLAVALMALVLATALPLGNKTHLLIDSGFSGPTIPLMALYSQTAISRKNMPTVSVLFILVVSTIHYVLAIMGMTYVMDRINKNKSKFKNGQISRIYFAGTIVLVLLVDGTLTISELRWKGLSALDGAKTHL